MTEILCITHKYPPVIGGMEKQSFELIKGLSRYYKTHVVAYQNSGNKAVWMANLKTKVQTVLKENPNIKLIHLNDGSMGAACLWLQKTVKIPVIVTFHGLDITFPLDVFQHRIVPRLAKYSGAICVSEFTRQQCLIRGFRENSLFTVKNGVDTSLDEIPTEPNFKEKLRTTYGIDVAGKHILHLTGRPVKRKGFSWFLKNVMPLLNDDIILLMTGPIKNVRSFFEKSLSHLPSFIAHNIQLLMGMATDTENVIEFLKKEKNAYHLGSVPYADLLQIFSIADLFLMPNIEIDGDEEGFGLVALEASIRGTYVLASGIEGITDAVIDGKNGTLLPSRNAQAWADKIHELLGDKERLQKLSAEGQLFTKQNYSWDIMVDGYREIFEQFISR